MTEKREWWSDDLINAVIDLQYHCLDCIAYDYSDIDPRNHDAVNAAWAYDVIAAVEDWQAQHEIVSAPAVLIDAVQRAAIAEAAIQRVREVCEQQAFPHCQWSWPCATRKLCDGGTS